MDGWINGWIDGWMDEWMDEQSIMPFFALSKKLLWTGYIHEIDIMHIKTISYLTLFLKSFWHLPFLFFHFLSCLFYYLSSSITETMPWLLPFYPPSDSDSPFLSLPRPSSPLLSHSPSPSLSTLPLSYLALPSSLHPSAPASLLLSLTLSLFRLSRNPTAEREHEEIIIIVTNIVYIVLRPRDLWRYSITYHSIS